MATRNGRKALRSSAIEPGRDEHVDLRGDHREGDEHGAEQRELHLGEEEFLRRGVDHLDRRIDAGGEPVGPDQEIVEVPREIEADARRRRRSRRATRSAAAGARRDAPSTAPWWPRSPPDRPCSRRALLGLLGARLLGEAALGDAALAVLALGFLARGFGVALGVGVGGGAIAAGAVGGTGSDGFGTIRGLSTAAVASEACA